MERYLKKFTKAIGLLDPNVLEKTPAVKNLMTRFSTILPHHFCQPRILISPRPELQSVLRADCACGTRAYIHIKRSETGWIFVEEEPQYDRFRNKCCDDCQSLF